MRKVSCVLLAFLLAFTVSRALDDDNEVEGSFKNLRLPLSVNTDGIVIHHSLFPPMLSEYVSAGLGHWDFGGATTITDDYIRLTPAAPSKEGWIWNDVPNRLPTWVAHVGFRVHGKGSLGADGFAVWYVESPAKAGGPLFGAPATFRGIGIIFDTFDNDNKGDNPSVSVIVGDGEEIFRVEQDLIGQTVGTCSYPFRNTAISDVNEAILEYNGDSLRITLHNVMRQTECVNISPFKLPEGLYFGLTAHTGQLFDAHDVHYFTVTATVSDQEAELEGNADAKTDGKVAADGQQNKGADAQNTATVDFSHELERKDKERYGGEGSAAAE